MLQPLTVLMKQTRQAVHAINQSSFLRCLWQTPTTAAEKLAQTMHKSVHDVRNKVIFMFLHKIHLQGE